MATAVEKIKVQTRQSDKVEAKKNPEKEQIEDSERNAKINELAYYKAECRGFQPGHEMEDWLEAEQDYLSQQKK